MTPSEDASDACPITVSVVELPAAGDSGSYRTKTHTVDGSTGSAHKELSLLLRKYSNSAYSIVTLGCGPRNVTLTIAARTQGDVEHVQQIAQYAPERQITMFVTELRISPAKVRTSNYVEDGTVHDALSKLLQQYTGDEWSIYAAGCGASDVSLTFMNLEGWQDVECRQPTEEEQAKLKS